MFPHGGGRVSVNVTTPGQNFFIFIVFRKNWSNSRLAFLLSVSVPRWEILDPPLFPALYQNLFIKVGCNLCYWLELGLQTKTGQFKIIDRFCANLRVFAHIFNFVTSSLNFLNFATMKKTDVEKYLEFIVCYKYGNKFLVNTSTYICT